MVKRIKLIFKLKKYLLESIHLSYYLIYLFAFFYILIKSNDLEKIDDPLQFIYYIYLL